MPPTDARQIHKDLSGEAAQLQSEYLLVHASIRSDDIQTFMPECWAGFVPLKAEYYKALAHYHASKSLPASGEMHERRDDDKNVDRATGGGGGLVAGVLSGGGAGNLAAGDAEVDTGQAKLAHIKESLLCHDETQRLQRMCRELKVSERTNGIQITFTDSGLVCRTKCPSPNC